MPYSLIRRRICTLCGILALCITDVACEQQPEVAPDSSRHEIGLDAGGRDAQSQTALTPVEIAGLAFPSTALVLLNDAAGHPRSLGSGFVIADGVVATNHHVIAGASSGSVKLVEDTRDYDVASIIAQDPLYDLALLQAPGLSATALPLSSAPPSVGDAVFVTGNPRGLEGTFSSGIVSALRPIGSDTVLQITAPISPGSSGGPVLDAAGEVVGVATATFQGGQNLNFAIPVSYLRALVARPSNPQPFREAASGATGEEAVFASLGERAVEGVDAGQFLWTDVNPYISNGRFSISVRNELGEPIRNVTGVIVFFDETGQPLDFATFRHASTVPPGLARRVHSQVDVSVKRLTTSTDRLGLFERQPHTRLDVRILGFDFDDSGASYEFD